MPSINQCDAVDRLLRLSAVPKITATQIVFILNEVVTISSYRKTRWHVEQSVIIVRNSWHIVCSLTSNVSFDRFGSTNTSKYLLWQGYDVSVLWHVLVRLCLVPFFSLQILPVELQSRQDLEREGGHGPREIREEL